MFYFLDSTSKKTSKKKVNTKIEVKIFMDIYESIFFQQKKFIDSKKILQEKMMKTKANEAKEICPNKGNTPPNLNFSNN